MAENFQCSSFCGCNSLLRMQESFVAKFRIQRNDNVDKEINNQYKKPNILTMYEDNSSTTAESIHKEQSESANADEDNESILHGSLDYEVLMEESKTPAPFFELMKETELNAELAKYGHGPMGKRSAVKLLNKIFEATHPVISANTPLHRKIKRTLIRDNRSKTTQKQWEKQTKRKIAQFSKEEEHKIVDKEKPNTKVVESFLKWLREPENDQFYNELLAMNPILIDRLFTSFGGELKEMKTSRERFAEVLDSLGVTYCLRNLIMKDI